MHRDLWAILVALKRLEVLAAKPCSELVLNLEATESSFVIPMTRTERSSFKSCLEAGLKPYTNC